MVSLVAPNCANSIALSCHGFAVKIWCDKRTTKKLYDKSTQIKAMDFYAKISGSAHNCHMQHAIHNHAAKHMSHTTTNTGCPEDEIKDHA